MSLIIAAAVDNALEERLRRLLAPGDVLRRWDGTRLAADDAKAIAAREPALVILGPDSGSPDASFELARYFDRHYPAICVLVVAAPEPETWRRALAAGVRGMITSALPDEELRTQLEEALDTARRRTTVAAVPVTSQPRVITVISPKGGSGKTIVSSNLAVGLALRAPGQAVLVDLDLQFGDVAYALALTPQHTMADAVSALEDLDATTLKVFLTRHQSGLYALCAPDEPAVGESIAAATTTAVIRMLAAEFRYVVADTPAGLSEHTLAALELSTDIILVSDMDVPSVRNLRKAADALDQLGMTSPTRHFVLNRADSRVGLDKEDVAAAAGMRIDLEIPSSRRVPVSLNAGTPLIVGSPRSPVARRVAELIDRIEHPTSLSADGRGGRS